MYPATGLPLARVVPEQGATIAGQFFPRGTILGVNAWVAHNNTFVFGSDASVFRPERWLESRERSAYMGRYFMSVSVSRFEKLVFGIDANYSSTVWFRIPHLHWEEHQHDGNFTGHSRADQKLHF